VKNCLKKYDDELERYIPVLMAQARIYWDRENYPMVEKLFFQSSEFCSEHEVISSFPVSPPPDSVQVWKLNVAHVFFMQETKFKDAIRSPPSPLLSPLLRKTTSRSTDTTIPS
jgi:tetratricopeptide repeat protein 30